jgi:hypothetical protein
MSWRDDLQARLTEIRPASVCALDEAARQLALGVLPDTPVSMHDTQPEALCALALGIDALIGLSAQRAQQLISRIRLFQAPRMLLVVPHGGELDEALFRALGFTLSAFDRAEGMRIHEFDLNTYKAVPEWPNARFWAHPERWEP